MLPNQRVSRFTLFGGLLVALFSLPVLPATAQRKPLKAVSSATRQLFLKGKYAEALVEIDQRLQQDSLNINLLGLRAECYLNLPGEAHAAAALTDLNKALRQQPNSGALLADRGHAYLVLHRYAESVVELDAALHQMPTDAALMAQRGYSYLCTNRLPEAVHDFAQATALSNNDPDITLMLAFSQMLTGNFLLALKTCTSLVEAHKDFGLGYAYRGTLRQRLNDPAGAREDANQALRISPADSTTQLISAFIYERSGETAVAQRLYADIQALAKSKSSFFFERGDLYLQVGDVGAAEVDWQRAAALGNADAVSRLAAHFQPHPN